MKKLELLGATALALLIASPSFAQTAAPQASDDAVADECMKHRPSKMADNGRRIHEKA